jgi:hypothetical protein
MQSRISKNSNFRFAENTLWFSNASHYQLLMLLYA